MDIPSVYADIQNLDDFNRLTLTCAGTLQDLERQGIPLHEGLVLTLCTEGRGGKSPASEPTQ